MRVSAVNRPELRLSIALYEGLLDDLRRIRDYELNCRGCLHSDKARPATCSKYKMVPPEEVQQVGCDDWEWDPCPF